MGAICTKEEHSLTPRGRAATQKASSKRTQSFRHAFDTNGEHNNTSDEHDTPKFRGSNNASFIIKARPTIANLALGYRQVNGNYISVQVFVFLHYNFLKGSWLGNCMGTLDISSVNFATNPQYLMRLYEPKTRVRFLVRQDAYTVERRVAKLFVFKIDTHGEMVSKFMHDHLVASSICTMSDFTLQLELDDPGFPFVVVVSHQTEQEGTFELTIETSSECTIAVPPQAVPWFDAQPHQVTVEGEWKGQSAGGNIDAKSWINSPQYPISVTNFTNCMISLVRKMETSLSMGLLVLKTNNVVGRYTNTTLCETDVVAKYTNFTSVDQITLRMNLEPGKYPYVIVPLVATQGMEGKYSIQVASDKIIEMHSDKSNTVELIEKVVLYLFLLILVRACGLPDNVVEILVRRCFSTRHNSFYELIEAQKSQFTRIN